MLSEWRRNGYIRKSIQPVIESVYESLTDLEKKIADYFLSDHVMQDDLSAKSVAKRLYVSLSSLTRFAKKCGFTRISSICL